MKVRKLKTKWWRKRTQKLGMVFHEITSASLCQSAHAGKELIITKESTIECVPRSSFSYVYICAREQVCIPYLDTEFSPRVLFQNINSLSVISLYIEFKKSQDLHIKYDCSPISRILFPLLHLHKVLYDCKPFYLDIFC